VKSYPKEIKNLIKIHNLNSTSNKERIHLELRTSLKHHRDFLS